MNLSIIGFGKLGSSTGFFLSRKGFKIYAYDNNKKVLKGFENKKPLFFEDSIKNFIKNTKINYVYNIKDAIQTTDLSYVIVPTPSLKNNNFDLTFIISTIDKIFPILKKKKTKHTIILTSTVSPGSCDKILEYIFNKYKMMNITDYRFIYNPYFIALGSIVNNLENPDLLLIGTEEKNVSFYKNYLKKIYKNRINKIKLNFLNYKEAEISKLAINCFVTMKISFSNSLSQISDQKLSKINTAKILNAIGSDTRIGEKYLGLGPMYSGPCFPRDNLAMLAFYKDLKISGDLFSSTDRINNLQTGRIIKILNDNNKFKNKRLGFLGLTYKSGTDLFTDSPAFYIINKIGSKRKNKITGYDPYFKEKVQKEISKKYKISIYNSLDAFIKNTDIIFLSYKDNKFSKITKYKKKIFIDPWNFLKNNLSNSKIICPGIYKK
jgi:UDPglucose 6-dehydrogenase